MPEQNTAADSDLPVEASADHNAAASSAQRVEAGAEQTATTWCDRCGEDATTGDHTACRQLRALEPPRYCAHCRRRLKVQVMPTGWTATCVEHGTLTR